MTRNRLLRLEGYVAGDNFVQSVVWTPTSRGDLLAYRSLAQNNAICESLQLGDAVCVIVGRVSNERLYVTPEGNYNPLHSEVGKCKYTFLLRPPNDPDFSLDWALGLANVERVQTAIATGNNRKNLLVDEGPVRFLRFSSDMYDTTVSMHDWSCISAE